MTVEVDPQSRHIVRARFVVLLAQLLFLVSDPTASSTVAVGIPWWLLAPSYPPLLLFYPDGPSPFRYPGSFPIANDVHEVDLALLEEHLRGVHGIDHIDLVVGGPPCEVAVLRPIWASVAMPTPRAGSVVLEARPERARGQGEPKVLRVCPHRGGREGTPYWPILSSALSVVVAPRTMASR